MIEQEIDEIERRFLVKNLPENLKQYPCENIIQGYIMIGADGSEVRLRKEGKDYSETVKGVGGKTRPHSEVEFTEDQFNKLWSTTEGKRLEKIRYSIPYQNRVIQLDIYLEKLMGHLQAEVEFPNEEESNVFTPPEWFGEEVTNDKGFKNQNLALYGLPESRK